MSALDEVLQSSALIGRWSFSIQATVNTALNANNMLFAQVPSWASRTWTVNLCSMLYSGGPLIIGASQPTANQVSTATPFTARVSWGVDGALETAIVDYPWGGCTFCVQASLVQVDILGGVSSAPTQPLLRGFLTPQPAIQTAVTAPTFTVSSSLAPLTQANTALPARATAYRFGAAGVFPAPGSIALTQVDANLTNVQNDGTYPPSGLESMNNRAGYYPIHRQAQFVNVQNASSTATQLYSLQFLLDMG